MDNGMTTTPDKAAPDKAAPENEKVPVKIVVALIVIAIILLLIAVIAAGVFPTPSPQEKTPTLSVLSLTPERGAPGTTVPVTMEGMNFTYGPSPSVWLVKTGEGKITATDVVVISPTRIRCTFQIPASIPAGQWDVVVSGADSQFGSKTGAFTVKNESAPPLTWDWSRDGWGDWQHGASCTGQVTTGSCSEYGPVIVDRHGEHGTDVAPDLSVPTQSSVAKTFTAPSGTTWNTITFNGVISSSAIPDARWMSIFVNGAQVFYADATRTPPGNGRQFTITQSFQPANTVFVRILSGQDPTFDMSLYTMQFNSLTLS